MRPVKLNIKRIVRKLLKKWTDILRLNFWEIEIQLLDEQGPIYGNIQQFAVAESLWEYKRIRITIYTKSCELLSDEEFEEMFVHELCHGVVAELSPRTNKSAPHEERVVTHLAAAFTQLERRLQDAKTKNKVQSRATSVAR